MTRRLGFLVRKCFVAASLACFLLLLALPATPEASGTAEFGQSAGKTPVKGIVPPPDLGGLLARVAEYCRRLESSAFDFVCREEINETINIPAATTWGGEVTFLGRTVRDVKNSYVYDYQCVRAGGSISEVRTLLKENGKEMNERNAALKTEVIVFGTTLMGPVGLFGARFQPDYDFSVVGQDKIGKTKVLVVDAHPKPGAPETTNLYGKAWIDPATTDILRIEWSESRVGRFEIFEKRGELYKRTPRLTIRSEFSAEKNGIRFPSRLSVEEAYLTKAGRAWVRSKTDVKYTNFKFFKVEVEIRY
jgi:hypothetical protein